MVALSGTMVISIEKRSNFVELTLRFANDNVTLLVALLVLFQYSVMDCNTLPQVPLADVLFVGDILT